MRRRVKARNPGVTPTVETIPVETAVRLVTLEDPAKGLRSAVDAFVRLRPQEGMAPVAIASWRDSVARVARAVKVLPAPRAADVPAASHRPEVKVGSIREESLKLAEEAGNEAVLAMVTTILDEVGA